MPTAPPVKVPIIGQDLYSKEFKKLISVVGKAGDKMQSLGRGLTTKVTAPLIGAGVASTKFAMDFNKSMANVGTLIPAQGARLEKFKTQVQDLSIEVAQGTDIIAEGLYETISAFGDAEDPMTKLTIASKAGTAGMSTTTEAMKLLSGVTKGYGDTSDEAFQKASDLAFMTVKLGQTTFPELASSMGKTIPLAKNLNVSQRELFAGFATLTGVTGNASEVSTQFNAALTAMVKPSGIMTTTVKKLGYESASTMVKEVGLVKSLQMISTEVDGNSDKMAKLMGRKEALTAALALTGAQADVFAGKMEAMGKVTGSTDEAFAAQSKGINKVGFSFEQTKRRTIVAMQRIGDILLPIFSKLLDAAEPWISNLTKMSEASLEGGLKIAAMAAAVGPALVIFGKLVSVGAGIASSLGSIGGAAAILTGPVGLVVVGILALGAAVFYLREELEPLRVVMVEELGNVFGDFQGSGEGATTMLQDMGASLKEVTALVVPMVAFVGRLNLKLAMAPLKNWITRFKVAFAVMRYAFRILSWGTAVVGVFSRKIKGVLQPALDKVNYFFGRLKAKIWMVMWPLRKLAGLMGKVGGALGGAFDSPSGKPVAMPKPPTKGSSAFDEDLDTDMYFDQGVVNGMKNKKDDSKVTVSFKDVPKGVGVKVDSGPVEVESDTGPIMEGGL